MQPIIEKIDINLILSELTEERLLCHTNRGGNEVYVVDAFNAPNTMREIGRLREISFRDAGGGTGMELDIDEFDTMENPCQQLIVWSPETQEIIGGYRFFLGNDIKVENGVPRIATSHMFNFSPEFLDKYLPKTLELGRSFVVIDYQNTKTAPKAIYALDNLWDGLGALTMLHPEIEYLFGKVTMYPNFGSEGRDMILGLLFRHFPDPDRYVWPIQSIQTRADSPEIQKMYSGDFREDLKVLNHELKQLDRRIPPLVNAYMSLSPTMRFFGTAVNYEFGNVEETGIFIKISEIYDEKKRRHIESFKRELSGYAATLRK